MENKSTTKYLAAGFEKLNTNFKNYLPFYLFFISVSFFEILTSHFIPKQFETLKLVIQIAIFFLMILSAVLFLRTQNRNAKEGDFFYIFIPFLLYSIYYSIIGILGLLLLFIPGVLFFYTPIIASLSDQGKPFKRSYQLARKNLFLTFLLSVGALILEVVPMGIKFIPNENLGMMLEFIYSIFEAYLSMFLMITAVMFYYTHDLNQKELDLPTI